MSLTTCTEAAEALFPLSGLVPFGSPVMRDG